MKKSREEIMEDLKYLADHRDQLVGDSVLDVAGVFGFEVVNRGLAVGISEQQRIALVAFAFEAGVAWERREQEKRKAN